MKRNASGRAAGGQSGGQAGGQDGGQDGGPDARQDPRRLLVSRLGFRGEEVLRNAEAQFPSQTRVLVEQLAALAATGELPAVIDGGRLLAFFRAVGLNVRMDTTIKVEKDGELVSLADKMRSEG
ncbi:MAG: double-stranded DNA-binding protein [Nitrosopumilus sp.]|nr:double-stranded DNA-binding protein [Nitrosopumilus sp.]